MSGYKRATISISEDEYNRLREAEIKLRAMPDIDQQHLLQIREESITGLESGLNQMRLRQVEFAQQFSGVGHAIRSLENHTNEVLMDYEARMVSEIQASAGNLWEQIDQVLAEYSQQFESFVHANHKKQQDELAIVSRNLRRMATDQEKKQAIASEWLTAAENIATFIQSNYAHEHFYPGRMDQIDRQIKQSALNFETGLSEAAIVGSQQLYFTLSNLRVALEKLQHEWSVLYQTALEATSQVLILAAESRQIQAVDLDGEELPYDINVNYWTQGKLNNLIYELNELKEQLLSGDDLPDIAALHDYLQIGLPEYYQVLQNIILDARVTAINSQLRINIADLVVQALQEQGFSLETAAYEGTDMRMGYDVKLVSLEGSEVVVKVEPTGSQLGENELHIQSMDSVTRTEHELQQRWYEVSRSLHNHGLDIGQYNQSITSPNGSSNHQGMRGQKMRIPRRGNHGQAGQGNGN